MYNVNIDFNIGDRWSIFSFRSSRNFVKIQITKVIYFSFTLYMFNLVLLWVFSVSTMCMKNHNVNWCILGFYSKKHEKYTQTFTFPPIPHSCAFFISLCNVTPIWIQAYNEHVCNIWFIYYDNIVYLNAKPVSKNVCLYKFHFTCNNNCTAQNYSSALEILNRF